MNQGGNGTQLDIIPHHDKYGYPHCRLYEKNNIAKMHRMMVMVLIVFIIIWNDGMTWNILKIDQEVNLSIKTFWAAHMRRLWKSLITYLSYTPVSTTVMHTKCFQIDVRFGMPHIPQRVHIGLTDIFLCWSFSVAQRIFKQHMGWAHSYLLYHTPH